MAIKKFSPLLAENPLCGIGEYKDALDLSTGDVTRRVKKLVLTGEETTWDRSSSEGRNIFYNTSITPDYLRSSDVTLLCTHYVAMAGVERAANVEEGKCALFKSIGVNQRLYIADSDFLSVDAFKSYLATQYAAGTPVTVWYVLATPETETITVPSGLTGMIEGYLTQSGTPTPSAPIYPVANPALAWMPTTYRKYGTETNVITTLPAQIIGDGQAITSCQISGNTMQDGTPTPEAPVDVQGVGEKTGNLLYKKIEGSSISSDGVIAANESFYVAIAKVVQGETYSTVETYMAFYTAEPTIGSISYDRLRIVASTFVAPITGYVAVRYPNDYSNEMLNSGSDALPYEPYGYKLPLTVNGTEYPIYLGQVETTRRIKKLVLKGDDTETYASSYSGYNCFFNYRLGSIGINLLISTHFIAANISSTSTDVGLRIVGGIELRIRPENVRNMTVADFKVWLQQQYAAGTPVTVWYVLATPETGIVNEPLMKIGDYADTVSATNIPTTGTPENFDVGTTLKPSEVQLTYHGWHEHDDTKYTQGE